MNSILTKAAQDALDALQIEQFRLESRDRERFTYEQKLEIILDHLAPVQAELDRLKKEMNEARRFARGITATGFCCCYGDTKCFYCKAQSWLERNDEIPKTT